MLMLFTKELVIKDLVINDARAQTKRFTRVRAGALMAASLVLGGCAIGGTSDYRETRSAPVSGSLSSSLSNSLSNSGGQSAASQESAIAFAQLPSSRPDVKVKPRSADLFSQSLAALASSDYIQAEALLLEITKIQPELSGPWLNLGQVYLAGDRTDSARSAFERAIEANPTNCAAFNQLGVLARREGRLNEAESSYLACIDRDPTFPQVYLNLGILYEVYLGRLPQALEAYREYQDLTASAGSEDNRVKGWVVDLERRL